MSVKYLSTKCTSLTNYQSTYILLPSQRTQLPAIDTYAYLAPQIYLSTLSQCAQLLINTLDKEYLAPKIYLSFYLSSLSQRAQLLAHTTALMRRRVLRSVLLAAVRHHLAPATRDINICSLLALRVVAEPSQLFAKALVLGHVLYGVVLAAVQCRSAPGTLEQDRPVLRIDLTRRVLALSDFPLSRF